MKEKLEARLKKAQEAQAKYYNKKHTPCMFKAGDKIYFNSKNFKLTHPSKKLNYKYYGPFEIEKPVGKQTYQLKLSNKMKIYNIFHISLLEPYTKTNDSNIPVPLFIIVERENKYKVKKILNSQIY